MFVAQGQNGKAKMYYKIIRSVEAMDDHLLKAAPEAAEALVSPPCNETRSFELEFGCDEMEVVLPNCQRELTD